LNASVPLARETITNPFLWLIAIASALAITFTRVESIWLVLAAAVAGLAAKAVVSL
jgi:hypothetical protein